MLEPINHQSINKDDSKIHRVNIYIIMNKKMRHLGNRTITVEKEKLIHDQKFGIDLYIKETDLYEELIKHEENNILYPR